MTSFHLVPGYAFSEKQGCTVSDILHVIKNISLVQLREKCLDYGISEDCVDEYVKSYVKIPSDDLTIHVVEDKEIVQSASGGDPCRSIKEQVRKALAILVLDECYKKGWSVSFDIV
jgi:hypothetical protein